MVQVDAKMFGVSSTVTLVQPERKATAADLHLVIKPNNWLKTSLLALEIKLNNIGVTFLILGLVKSGKRVKDWTKSLWIWPFWWTKMCLNFLGSFSVSSNKPKRVNPFQNWSRTTLCFLKKKKNSTTSRVSPYFLSALAAS